MTKFVIRRSIQAIPVLFGITIVVYGILLAAPGGPEAKFANYPRITQEQKEKFKEAWGLDQPIPIQYCRWMGICNPESKGTFLGSLPAPAAFIGPTGLPNFLPEFLSGATNGVLHGDFGYSIGSGEKVSDRVARAALPTFILAGVALVGSMMLAVGASRGACRGAYQGASYHGASRAHAARPVVTHLVRHGTVIDTLGPEVVAMGETCTVERVPDAAGVFDCRIEVRCGEQILYGTTLDSGYVQCGGREVVRDGDITARDGDPAMTLDLASPSLLGHSLYFSSPGCCTLTNSVLMSELRVGPVASASLGIASTRNALPKLGFTTPAEPGRWAGSRSR